MYDFITEAGVPYDSQPVPAAIQNRFDFSTAGVAAATMSQAVASAVKALPVSDDLGEAH
ncbi:MAG: hypothetical protein MJ231_05810 [bacterium]|nr:hypothetical protein [bacterium]